MYFILHKCLRLVLFQFQPISNDVMPINILLIINMFLSLLNIFIASEHVEMSNDHIFAERKYQSNVRCLKNVMKNVAAVGVTCLRLER